MKHILKSLITVLTLLFLFNFGAFATGAGLQFGADPGIFINQDEVKAKVLAANITGTVRLSRLPLVAGAGFEGGKYFSDFNYGFSAFCDYWALDLQLENTWSIYSGFGASTRLLTDDFSDWKLETAARFFTGVNRLFYDGYLEVYAQQNIAPSYITALNDNASKGIFMLYLPFEAGLRMHF